MRHAYVYYRIDLAQAGLAASRIDTLLASMAAFCSRPPRRLIRCKNPETWMEIYEDIPDMGQFVAALDDSVATLRCSDFTLDERHLECFVAPGFD